jgi:hypothetical protein
VVVTGNGNGTITVTGTAEPGATLTVTYPDGTTGSVIADIAGHYSITSPGVQSSGTVTAQATDVAGNDGPSSTAAYVDAVDPTAPSVTVTGNGDGTITVTGTAEPRATLTVTYPDGTSGSVIADVTGHYSITSPGVQSSGTVTAQATDVAGNDGPSSTAAYVDAVDPAAPSVTVTGNGDGTITVTGTAEPGATLTVTYPDGTTGTVVAGPNGNYTITSPGVQTTGTVTAQATDAAGNDGPSSTAAYVDAVDPTAPSVTVTGNGDGTITVTGTAEPGATLTVTYPDGTTGTVVAGPNGQYSITSPGVQTTGTVTAQATDAAGNDGPSSTAAYVDAVDPAAPSVTVTGNGDGTITVTGTAEPGATLTVTYPDGTFGSVVAGPNGNYAITSPGVQTTGTVTAQATDAAGNEGPVASAAYTDAVDPAAPSVTVTGNGDGTITVTGTAEPGATLTVTYPDGTTGSVIADIAGHYSITSPGVQSSGTVTAQATDVAGNDGPSSTAAYVDAVDPTAPSVTVTGNGDGTITVTGTAEPGATLTVTYPDGTFGSVVAGPNGNYAITSPGVQTTGTVTAQATDAAGNEGPVASAAYTDAVDPAAPSVTVTGNGDGTITVTGTAEPGATLTVTYPDGTSGSVIADVTGHYSITSPGVQSSGTVTAQATDVAGNDGPSSTAAYVDAVDPAAPSVTVTGNGDGTITVTGTAEPGATLTVTYPDGTTGTVIADVTGHYSITSPGVQSSGTVTAQATDVAGNDGPSSTAAYVDAVDPAAPSVTVTGNGDGTITVTGTTEPGATLTVTYPDGTTGSVIADIAGHYSITSPGVQTTGTVTAQVTDAAGNDGPTATAAYVDAVDPAAPSVTVTGNGDGTITVTGTAEPGATLTVTYPDGTSGSVIADVTGHYSITSPGVQSSGTVTAQATDVAGNDGPSSTAAYVDAVDPAAPSVTVTGNGDGTITVTGTAEPGATLTVTYPDGTTGTVVAGPNGNYTITSPGVQTTGTVTAQATDAAGNDGPSSTAAYVDAVDPTAPSVTVTGNGDGTITVTGTAEPGATLTVTYPDGTTGTVVAGPNGQYSITSPGVQTTGTVTAQATDAAGNDGPSSTAAYVDAVDPAAPSVTVTGNGDGTITVTGTAEPGATLTVTYPDGTTGTVIADIAGHYSITSPGVQSSGTVTAQATDVAGNDGPSSTAAYVDAVDPTAPSVTVTGNGDGTITVTGTAEPRATLTVTYPDGTFGSVVAGPNGNYAITSPGVQTTGTVTAQATDAAGNEGPVASAAYTDAVDPAAPSVTVTGNGDGTITVTGTTEPGATLTVTYPDGTTGSVIADIAGHYSITSPGVQTTGTVTAQVTDAAGNDGPTATAAYVDAVDPAAPSVTVTGNGDGTITVTGTAEPGATLTVTYPDGTSGSVIADVTGHYSITSPGVQSSGTVTAQATDVAGNDGPSSTAAYVDAVDPAAPSVTVTGNGDGTITVTGTAEPGATLTVTYPDGTTGTVVAGPNGNYTITSPGVQTTGTVTAQATDAAGNDGPSSTAAYVDAVDPTAPSVTVTGNGDGTITVTGTAEPGATLTVTYPDGTTGTVVAGPNGQYSITSPGVQTTGTVTAQATDAAGNDGPSSTAAYVDAVDPAAPSVTVTGNGDGTITVTGTAEPGATLTVTYPDGTTGTVIADITGQYAITSPGVQSSGTVTAQATDAAGNDGPSSTAAYTDAVDPDATATITAFTDNQSQHIGDFLSGALTNDAEPLLKGDVSSLADGDIVRIYRGAALIGTAAIAGNSWSFQLGALAEGTHSYVAVIADQAGNEGAPSSPFSLTVDTAITPGTLSLTGFTDTGTSASDFLTQDTAFDLSLAGSEAGAAVVYQISANAGASWTATTPVQAGLTDGAYLYRAVVTDAAGNSAVSNSIAVTVDTAITPGTLTLAGFTDTGTSASDFLTQDTAFDLSLAGSEAGAAIVYQISADAGASWAATTPAQSVLADGAYLYRAVVTDAAGNSAASNSIAVTIDNTAPAAAAITLTGYTDSGASASDFISTDATFNLSLSGQEAAADVAYSRSADGGATWTATTSAQTGLADGQYQFRADVTDAAGNAATTNAFTVTVDTAITPGTLTLANFTDTGTSASDFLTQDTTFDLSLAGSEAGASILYQVSANAGASWTATTSAQTGLLDGAYLYRAVVTDAAGNSAASNSIAVTVDNTAPAAGAITLTGYTDSGTSASDFISTDATFNLSLSGQEAAAGVGYSRSADGGATWTATTSTQTGLADGQYQFHAVVTDAAGNVATTNAFTVTVAANAPVGTAAVSGISQDGALLANDFATNDNQLLISGTNTVLHSGEIVRVSLDNGTTWLTATQASATTWSLDRTAATALANGTHTFLARVESLSGVVGTSSSQAVIINSAANAQMVLDLNATSDNGASTTDNITGLVTPSMTGTVSGLFSTEVAAINSGRLKATLFVDGDNDGVIDAGEVMLSGISMTGSGSSATFNVSMNALPNGSYNVKTALIDTVDSSVKLVGLLDGSAVPRLVIDTAGTPSTGFSATANSGLGSSAKNVGDFNGDGYDDFLVTAPQQLTLGGSTSGSAYILYGSSTGLPNVSLASLTAAQGIRVTNTDGRGDGYPPYAAASTGDLNNDGYADVVMSSHVNDGGVIIWGRGGNTTASINVSSFGNTATTDGTYFHGNSAWIGASVAVGDMNADGYDDLLVGDIYNDNVWVIFGHGGAPGSASWGNFYLSEGAGLYTMVNGAPVSPLSTSLYMRVTASGSSSYADELASNTTILGDVNGDGINDYLLTSPLADDGAGDAGTAYLVFGSRTPLSSSTTGIGLGSLSSTQMIKLTGAQASEWLGGRGETNGPIGMLYNHPQATANLGDINGDGIADFAIGSPGWGDSNNDDFGAGRVYVIYGKANGVAWSNISLATLNGTNGFILQKPSATIASINTLGYSISGLGDANGDGISDFVVSAPNETVGVNISAGAAYLVYGQAGGFSGAFMSGGVADLDAMVTGGRAVKYTGTSVNGLFGSATAFGDWNGDGFADVSIGENHGSTGALNGGTYYAYFTNPRQSHPILFTRQRYPGGGRNQRRLRRTRQWCRPDHRRGRQRHHCRDWHRHDRHDGNIDAARCGLWCSWRRHDRHYRHKLHADRRRIGQRCPALRQCGRAQPRPNSLWPEGSGVSSA